MSHNPARPGLGIRHGDDHAVDEPDGEVVFSFLARQRIRETSQEAHRMVVNRLRYATRQGAAATAAQLASEVVELHRAITAARTAHGPAHDATMCRVRVCYLEAAATCLILAERATRPAELKRGEKSSTTKWRPPTFEVPRA
jgi:hypothetical protein